MVTFLSKLPLFRLMPQQMLEFISDKIVTTTEKTKDGVSEYKGYKNGEFSKHSLYIF